MKCKNVSSVLVLINWKYLSIPFILLDVKMAHDDFSISEDYYTPVTCFLTFNFCAVLGNLIPNLLTFVSILYYFLIYISILGSRPVEHFFNHHFLFYVAITSLGIYSNDVTIFIPAIFPTLQLSPHRSWKIMACDDTLGLCLLDG